jgi:uncharacterized caspase-like protein
LVAPIRLVADLVAPASDPLGPVAKWLRPESLRWGPPMRVVKAFACAVTMLCLGSLPSHAEKRVALVIGNGNYQHADKLSNPVTDARRLRDTLGKLAFEIVYGENVGKQQLERTIGRFANAAQDADVALVFFAGHGATFGDVPYVVPVDAQFSSIGEMPYELVQVETLIGELRRAKGLRIAILDACRDNSAERELKRVATRGGEVTRGLGRVKNPEGLILAYATQYLSTAADGDPNGDSPFTTALLNNIATPGLDVKDLFYRVGREVIASTRGGQRPEISVSFYDDYALVPGGSAAAVKPPIVSPPQDPAERAWAVTKDTTSLAVLEEFIRQFGATLYGSMARARLEELKKSQVAVAAPPAQTVRPPGQSGSLSSAPSQPLTGFCRTRTVTGSEKKKGYDGTEYDVHFDFTRGSEQLNTSACGREYWISPSKNNSRYGIRFVYLVDAQKRRVSETLYVEGEDGALRLAN